MRAKILTTEEIRVSSGRDYNPMEWDRKINRYVDKYKDVVFYVVEKGGAFSYDRYFVEYTLLDGLRLFGRFGYGESITSGGFYRLGKSSVTADGRSISDVLSIKDDVDAVKELLSELNNSKFVELSSESFSDGNGNEVLFGTSKEARNEMTDRSVKYNMTFTKEGL